MSPELQAVVNGIGLDDEQLRTVQSGNAHPGRFPGTKEGISETMHGLSGRVTIADEDGTKHDLAQPLKRAPTVREARWK